MYLLSVVGCQVRDATVGNVINMAYEGDHQGNLSILSIYAWIIYFLSKLIPQTTFIGKVIFM